LRGGTSLRCVPVLLLAIATADAHGSPPAAQDRSSLFVEVDGPRLLVVDPNGRLSGLDTTSGHEINEIPHAGVAQDAIDDDVTGEPGAVSVTVTIQPPVEGIYKIIVVDPRRLASQLAVDAFAIDGSEQPDIRVAIDYDKAGRAEFRFVFRKTPGSMSRLERVDAPGVLPAR
jgi:hypothetical protein